MEIKRAKFNAQEIAKWFLYKNYAEQKSKIAINENYEVYDGITHLKLQQLLYNAQGLYLAIKNEKLFENDIRATEYGPIIIDVFDTYCVYGKNEIIIPTTPENSKTVRKIEEDKEVKEILQMAYDNFIKYTSWELREKSHKKGSPWEMTQKNQIIDTELIKDYFKKEVIEE